VSSDIWEELEMQESIIQYSGIVSGTYEEKEVFDNEFNVESSPDNE